MDNKPSGVAWLALIISILALILAWNAFNRAGQDLEAMIAEEVEEATREIREEYEQAEDAVLEGTADALEGTANALDEGAEELQDGADNTEDAASDVRRQQ